MSKTVDYYFSLVSPWTYLGSERLEQIVRKHHAEVAVKPVNLGTIFPQSGGLPLAKRAPQRQAYRLVELERWRKHLGMTLNLQPKFFPAAEALAARMVHSCTGHRDRLKLSHAIMRAVWTEERNIADPQTLRAIARACELDSDALLRAADGPEAQQSYDAATAEALACGVFGAPSYVYRGELFWGQDRLEFLDRALAA